MQTIQEHDIKEEVGGKVKIKNPINSFSTLLKSFFTDLIPQFLGLFVHIHIPVSKNCRFPFSLHQNCFITTSQIKREIWALIFTQCLSKIRQKFESFCNFLTQEERFKKVMFYGTVAFDPWLIVAQIVCLQCLHYLTLGVFLSILVGTRVSKMSLVYFFDYATVDASTVTGWCVMASILLSSIAGAGYFVYLVERAKKCLDFCATLYIIHLFICIIYGGWPSSITWWVVNITSLAVTALLGEYLCMKRELREIPISRYRSIA